MLIDLLATRAFNLFCFTLNFVRIYITCTYTEEIEMCAGNKLWLFTKKSITGALIGITVSDRYASIATIRGSSMHPTFSASEVGLSGLLKADIVLVEKFCLEKYEFSRGDVIIFKSPTNHRQTFAKRLIALPGDWVQIPESSDVFTIPEGHCWVEGDNAAHSFDSRSFGSVPLGLIQGRVTHVIWPPQRISKVERKTASERCSPQ
ncbi:mitochondrial inner membrane protease subunit 2-like isoform X1 [Zingiber officinale]|uniref:mitochondrial inner membrane protease subunit 2-like isoform X1 n=2 Tax=Zingiber officinale TaxID=94328 RepID=UPI001C4B5027|nr:mitochondrial inner membrane protease subunit 2-like isoform X1 [Zingiber officinale]